VALFHSLPFNLFARHQQQRQLHIGFFPHRKEIFISFTTFRRVARERHRTRQAQMRMAGDQNPFASATGEKSFQINPGQNQSLAIGDVPGVTGWILTCFTKSDTGGELQKLRPEQ
jgi:hypothetical protein